MGRRLCQARLGVASARLLGVRGRCVLPQKHPPQLDLTRTRRMSLRRATKTICWFGRRWWPCHLPVCQACVGLQSSGSLRSFGRNGGRGGRGVGGAGGGSPRRQHAAVLRVLLGPVLGDASFCPCRLPPPRRKQDITAATSRPPPWS